MRLSAGEGTPGLAAAFPVEKVNAIKGKKKKKEFFLLLYRECSGQLGTEPL